MTYEYINDDTGEVVERDFPMSGDIPKIIEVNGKTFRRDYAPGRIPAIHIPLHWGDGNNPIRFNKSPSGKKKVF
jgi:hypothetical protein